MSMPEDYVSWRSLAERRKEDNDGLIEQIAALEARGREAQTIRDHAVEQLYRADIRIAQLEANLALADRVAVSGVRLANGGSEHVRKAVIEAYAEYAQAIGRPTSKETKVDEAALPIGYCDGCGRHVWKRETIGLTDETFVNGKTCNGVFVEFEANRRAE